MKVVLLGLLTLVAATAVGPRARGEIQTLFRGECYTPEEAAKKLAAFGEQFTTADQWQARAAAIRRGVLRGARLETPPKACELKPIRHSLRRGDGYTVENVAFESLPGFWVTGNLYRPDPAPSEPMPGVLCPHGHAADSRLQENVQKRGASLARLGCTAFAYDMVGYGESAPVPHHHAETFRLQTHNSRRALDFLESLGDVDESRLAVTGESGGGTQTFILGCVDDRIDLAVPVVMVSAHFYGGCICESGLPIHKSADHETNNVEIAATLAPKPQLVISVGSDWTAHVPETELPYLKRVYRLMGAEDNVENAHFADEDHDYGPSKRKAMYKFVAQHFLLDLGRLADERGELDESFAVVRPRAELEVFPADRPRPPHAEKDAERVIALLDAR